MKIAVVGAGAVGSLFGGRLAAAGHTVWLVHRRREIVDVLRRDGLRLAGPDGEVRIAVNATDETREVGPVDLVLVLTKSHDTGAAAEASRALVDDASVVLTLQNGLGNVETLAHVLGQQRVLMGMTYLGAAMLGPGHVRHTAAGATFVGEVSGSSRRAAALAETFTAAGLPTTATDDLWPEVWAKLVINSAINASCALTGATGRTALASPAAREWLCLVAAESAAVAAALGVRLPYTDPPLRVLRHCRDIDNAQPSMLQDMLRNRPTEIEAINGAIVREGERVGVPTPYNRALLLLVRARQEVARTL